MEKPQPGPFTQSNAVQPPDQIQDRSAKEPTKSTNCMEERTVTILMTGLEQNRR
jgi:hypothetical protein